MYFFLFFEISGELMVHFHKNLNKIRKIAQILHFGVRPWTFLQNKLSIILYSTINQTNIIIIPWSTSSVLPNLHGSVFVYIFVSILLCLMACVLCQSKKIYHSMNSNKSREPEHVCSMWCAVCVHIYIYIMLYEK